MTKTKRQIIDTARQLFNQRGLRNTTLRDVAAALGKSYGNVTYHFANKEVLLEALYEGYLEELQEIGTRIRTQLGEGLDRFLAAPSLTFELAWRYLFFSVDYVELRRHFPRLVERMLQEQHARKQIWLGALRTLQAEGFLRADLGGEELDYLMELSGVVRTFFFQQISGESASDPEAIRGRYLRFVNQLLWPYLSAVGRERYRALGF
ncbi:MAG: TetR family transcriptional regulator [Bacteroidota bacterium]